MNYARAWIVLSLAGIVVGLAGCTKPLDPSLAPVSGTVTIGSEPLAGAKVTFIPKDGTTGFGGVGTTDSSGRYKLAGSRDNEAGIPPGEYRVVISKRLNPDGSEPPPGEQPMMSAAKESLPDAYSSMSMTTLTATVPAGGATLDFPLTERKKK
jgi:hypothetical protein